MPITMLERTVEQHITASTNSFNILRSKNLRRNDTKRLNETAVPYNCDVLTCVWTKANDSSVELSSVLVCWWRCCFVVIVGRVDSWIDSDSVHGHERAQAAFWWRISALLSHNSEHWTNSGRPYRRRKRRGYTGAGETPLCQPHNLYSNSAIKYIIIPVLIKLYYDFQFLEFALGNRK